MTESEKVLMNT